MMNKFNPSIILAFSMLAAPGCTPEIGNKAWCELMDKKPKVDWSLNDASEYAKNCI
ncbi:MAG: DUF3012 domain-containing protein [Methylococcales bacterium]